MPRFEPWQIVAVPFPYVERPVQQRRPALIVTTGLGGSHDLLWVLMITAAAHRRWPGDVEIEGHASVGLPIPSVVRTAKIATIAASFAQRLGFLPGAHVAEITMILRQRLPIDR
jgi:mRNA-degrading endonuclease toxin of MazEF toxin-antitoxin module